MLHFYGNKTVLFHDVTHVYFATHIEFSCLQNQHVTVIFSFQKLMFTFKGHLLSSKTNLFFSLFQTLPDFGFPRGIFLGLFGASCVVVAAILFNVRPHIRQRKFTIVVTSSFSTWRLRRSVLDEFFFSLPWCFSVPDCP